MKILPRRPRFYLRVSHAPQWAQDFPTYILAGRFIHIFNLGTRNWFFVSEPPDDIQHLNRANTQLIAITWKTYHSFCGRRAWLELIEDLLGVRATRLAQLLLRLPLLKYIRPLRRLSRLDQDQDWSEWYRFEPPKILGMEMKQ